MSWDIPIGSEFAGYRITGILGRGGMSVVFTAEHVALGRTVALKVLAPGLAIDQSFRDRFVRESQLAATLEHPNIIPIYDAGEADGYLYIAMRHIDGGDLGSLLEQSGPLSFGQTIFFVEQVAGALDEAHSKGLVHRDVKPANILIARPSDRVYLTDFGVVKQTSTAMTATGYFIGTFAYAAPEQIEGREIDGRTDVYALGCVLHECLSGAPPFDARTEAAIIHAHLVEPPPRLTARRPELPVGIDDVIATAMAKSKEDRYETCAELVRMLRAVALGTGSTRTGTAIPVPTPEQLDAPIVAATVLARSGGEAPAAPAPPTSAPSEPAAPRPEPPLPPPPPPTPPAPVPTPEQSPEPQPAAAAAAKPPRTVTLSGRRMVAIGAAAVAVLAAAVVAAVLIAGGGGGQSAAGTTTATTTGAGGTAPGAVGLALVVPNQLYKSCTPVAPAAGAAETVTCKPPATTGDAYYPTSWDFSLFRNVAALHKAYDAVRRDNDIGTDFGQCNGVGWGGEGTWAHGPGKPGGHRLCYFEGNVAVIVWTHEKLGQASHIDFLGTARSSGSDHSNLFSWYRFWHHRVGKCPAPDCVARLS